MRPATEAPAAARDVNGDEIERMFDDAMEEAFGRDPDDHDDRRYGFKLP